MRNANIFLIISLMAPCCAAENGALLERVADISIPGDATRFDYQSFDPETGRLYIAHMGDGALVVFDTRAEKIIANIEGFPRATGVLIIPQLKRVYVSAAGAHEVVVVDADRLTISKRISGGKFLDGLAWSPKTHKLFVSDEVGAGEIVIDTDKDERVAAIEMGGEVGNTQYDPTSHLFYACVQTRDQLVAIDPTKNAITARYDLKGGKHPHGLYIDDKRRKAYIACEGNDRLLVFNLKTHEIEDSFPVGSVPDVLAFDTGLNRLYVAAERGPVTIFHWDDATRKLMRDGQIEVGDNAHSVSVDSATHKVYFPLKSGPVLRIMQPALHGPGGKQSGKP